MIAAAVARALSGYLCGTKRASPALGDIAAAHRALARAGATHRAGHGRWDPPPEAAALRDRLVAALETDGILDLVIYGSQPRGTTTGFSDVDAALVISDAVAEDPERLRALRTRVLAAQRAVLAHQPMQHHGFDVVSPKLLARGDALPLPEAAWTEAASLFGRGAPASFARADEGERRARFDALARPVLARGTWPRHVWNAHRHVSMLELLPTLYVQALGHAVPKPESFGAARAALGAADWAYDDLRVVRERWPRRRRPILELAASAARNPWPAVAAWRNLHAPLPRAVAPLLTPSVLARAHDNVRAMQEHLG